MLKQGDLRRRNRWLLAALSVVALTIGAACGGSDDGSIATLGSGKTQDGVANAPASNEAALPIDRQSGDTDSYYSDGSASSVGTTGAGSGGPLPALLDRQIIRTATISIETQMSKKPALNVSRLISRA